MTPRALIKILAEGTEHQIATMEAIVLIMKTSLERTDQLARKVMKLADLVATDFHPNATELQDLKANIQAGLAEKLTRRFAAVGALDVEQAKARQAQIIAAINALPEE